jgi:hypothetical protein
MDRLRNYGCSGVPRGDGFDLGRMRSRLGDPHTDYPLRLAPPSHQHTKALQFQQAKSNPDFFRMLWRQVLISNRRKSGQCIEIGETILQKRP